MILLRHGFLELLLYTASFLHIYISPYTKVEESFNLQACHDIIYHRTDLDQYDHHIFPGVVPRTFIAPLVISLLGSCVSIILQLSKFSTLHVVRGLIATRIVKGLILFINSVGRPYSRYPLVKKWLFLTTLSQFHLLFYASRPLPNIFALALVLPAFAAYVQQKTKRFVLLSAGAILIFRAELAVLLGLMLLFHLLEDDTYARIKKTLMYGVLALLVFIPMTVLIDSVFWRRWLWPELEVLYFNTVLNKSHQWGVMPFTWYFHSALPRSLMTSLPFLLLYPFVAPTSQVFKYFLPPLVFIFLYSFLPHKELRFIIYTIPMLNYCISAVYSTIWSKRKESILWRLFSYCTVLSLVANVCLTCIMTYVSSINYPGGEALTKLHAIVDSSQTVKVHMDVASCQTGISRFIESNPAWIYDKSENITPQQLTTDFTHLLILKDDFNAENMKQVKDNFEIIGLAKGLDTIKETFPFRYPRFSEANSTIFIVEKRKTSFFF